MHRLLSLLLALAAALAFRPAGAEPFPSKPIRLVAPFSAGGALDLIARAVAGKLAERIGQTVVVENRAGASGAIGCEAVARAAPDGYTLLLGATTTHGINPALNPKLGYDPERDFTAISLVATIPHVLVIHPGIPARTLAEFVGYAKAHPKLSFGSAGNGSPHHLAGEMLALAAGIEAVHVPYKGSAPALADLISGQIQFMSVELVAAEPYVKAGKLRALALESAQRVPDVPLPTFAESGYPGFEVTAWYAVFGPAGMNPEVTAKLAAEIARAMQSEDLRERLRKLGATALGGTPAELAAHVHAELARWTSVVKTAGIKAE